MNEQIQAMLDRLGKEGGIIMSSHECSNLEIAQAQAGGNFYVDDDMYGFVYVPHSLQQIIDISTSKSYKDE